MYIGIQTSEPSKSSLADTWERKSWEDIQPSIHKVKTVEDAHQLAYEISQQLGCVTVRLTFLGNSHPGDIDASVVSIFNGHYLQAHQK